MHVTNSARPQTLYELAGGGEALHRMTERFYRSALADPLLGAMFAGLDDHPALIASYFSENFGGPPSYSTERGGLGFLLEQHVGLRITDSQRERWVELMVAAASAERLPEAFVRVFARYLTAVAPRAQQVSHLDHERTG